MGLCWERWIVYNEIDPQSDTFIIGTMSSSAPMRNSVSVPVGMGARVKPRIRTMAVMGRTDFSWVRCCSLWEWGFSPWGLRCP